MLSLQEPSKIAISMLTLHLKKKASENLYNPPRTPPRLTLLTKTLFWNSIAGVSDFQGQGVEDSYLAKIIVQMMSFANKHTSLLGR